MGADNCKPWISGPFAEFLAQARDRILNWPRLGTGTDRWKPGIGTEASFPSSFSSFKYYFLYKIYSGKPEI